MRIVAIDAGSLAVDAPDTQVILTSPATGSAGPFADAIVAEYCFDLEQLTEKLEHVLGQPHCTIHRPAMRPLGISQF